MCFNFVAYYPLGAWEYCFGADETAAFCDDFVEVNSWGTIQPSN